MKGLRFNLRTLFVLTALLAVIVYVTWRVRQHRPVGDIPEGMFALQLVQDEGGLLFTITASTEPIENVVVELRNRQSPNVEKLVFGTGLIAVEPCERKRVRVQQNPGQLPSVEMPDLIPIVRLPLEVGNGLRELRLPYHRADYHHLGYVRDGKIIDFENGRGQIFSLTILINQTASEALLP